jgi:hypothetical protein
MLIVQFLNAVSGNIEIMLRVCSSHKHPDISYHKLDVSCARQMKNESNNLPICFNFSYMQNVLYSVEVVQLDAACLRV